MQAGGTWTARKTSEWNCKPRETQRSRGGGLAVPQAGFQAPGHSDLQRAARGSASLQVLWRRRCLEG